jgi:hypothetical protein
MVAEAVFFITMLEVSHARVSFRLWSDSLDPDPVTARLSISPTEAGAIGEVWTGRRSGREFRRPTGTWSLKSTLPDAASLDEHLTQLLDQLHPKASVIRGFLAQGWSADFFCGLFLDHWNEGTELGPSTLGRIADLGVQLGLDIYSHSTDDPDDGG